nr:fibronectin type III domain-containing protein [Calditrichia bacterium]
NEETATMPVADSDGFFIKRYSRYQPPKITVDGREIQDPFPLDGSDEVNPDIIPGTADMMVTSTINTDMGVTITQKVLSWSQANHDDYIIYDWTFTNTGNIDLDDDIELPNQTLTNVYFLRSSRLERWDSQFWYSGEGDYAEDTLRLRYAYPGRRSDSGTEDNTGNGYWEPQPGWMWNPMSVGQAILHADRSVSDPTDDFNQPMMTGTENSDLLWIRNDPTSTGPADWAQVWRGMTEGWEWRGEVERLSGANVRPGFRSVHMEDQAVPGVKYITDLSWVTFGAAYFWAAGPYTLAPGEDFRIVWADGFGVINPLKIWEVQTAWENGNATPPPGMTFDNAGGVGLVDNMPTPYKNNPELYNNNFNDWARDAWIFTGIDSLKQNMNNAQWNVRNNYNVPAAPQPPSITVNSLPNKIEISWGDESEDATDFAGYKLYRSEGFWYEGYLRGTNTREHGQWELIGNFPGSGTHSYDDTDVTRGISYFYKVVAYDDGTQNGPDVDGGGHPLESGHFLNVTRRGAVLTRPAKSDLSEVVIVPNPFNSSARELQYPGEPDKILFLELPPVCTIRIYTESGDLVKVIEHDNGSGDESWGLNTNEHMTSETGQIVVSGIYIVNFSMPNGESVNKKMVIVR